MKDFKKVTKILFFLFFTGLLIGRIDGYSEEKKYWIFFKDKGSRTIKKGDISQDAEKLGISQRALRRRAKVRTGERLIHATDFNVVSEYICALEDLGLKPQVISRWLNATSVVIPSDVLDQVLLLPFVQKVQPVASFSLTPLPSRKVTKRGRIEPSVLHTLDYGPSYMQNNQIHVPEVHDLGITGEGVLVGMIDTGFDYLGRSVFNSLDVTAEHDFHWNDDVTANEENDPLQQHDHGTITLSLIGGFHESYLIGTAYKASFALAKTEWIPTETRVEEDHWVEGIEWLETFGVDVISSSLGYTYFDDGFSYTYQDLDGNTCVTTKAADIAVSKGVVVVSSAGNERQNSWHYITSPGDGDSVITVGAVNTSGNLANFSSVGPTSDGRIKPDVVALGIGGYAVNPWRDSEIQYLSTDGTSISCPLVAGVCALILQAHPELGPTEVREALWNTADRVDQPDTLYGWGLVNAYEAVFYHGVIFKNLKRISLPAEELESIEVDILSKNGIKPDSVFLYYRTDEMGNFHLVRMISLGGSSSHRFRAYFPSSINVKSIRFYIKATDNEGISHAGPYKAPNFLYSFSDSQFEIIQLTEEIPERFKLYQNYPNPFNEETKITFDIPNIAFVNIKIFNIMGQEIITLIHGNHGQGKKEVRWRGTDYLGRSVSSGIYFCQMEVGGLRQISKMILVR